MKSLIKLSIVSLVFAASLANQIVSTRATEKSAAPDPGAPCQLAVPCILNDRSYHARLPDNWDGKTPLPVLMHFHGWGRQGTLIMKHERIAGATRERGVLLLAPNGLGRSWQFWSSDTEDIPFGRAVLEDAAKRWPIDTSKIFVSGYSYGSAMAWRFACAEGARINTLLAVAGTLPSQDEECHSPVRVRHVHGTSDNVMDYPFGPQGDVEHAVKLWRDRNKCDHGAVSKTNWQLVPILPFTRYEWKSCGSGKSVVLDAHTRGHFIPRFWIGRQLDELL